MGLACHGALLTTPYNMDGWAATIRWSSITPYSMGLGPHCTRHTAHGTPPTGYDCTCPDGGRMITTVM